MANILVVDDESVLLNLMSATLRLDGHAVTTMSDPLAACDAFRTQHPSFDLILTDVTMEPISGFELVERVSKMGFASPVLFMSGYSASGAIENLGEGAILAKPFTARELRAAVSRALAKNKAKSSLAG